MSQCDVRGCENPKADGRLCVECENDRMLSASCDRIFSGTGLTYSNVEKYSQENWIANVEKSK